MSVRRVDDGLGGDPLRLRQTCGLPPAPEKAGQGARRARLADTCTQGDGGRTPGRSARPSTPPGSARRRSARGRRWRWPTARARWTSTPPPPGRSAPRISPMPGHRHGRGRSDQALRGRRTAPRGRGAAPSRAADDGAAAGRRQGGGAAERAPQGRQRAAGGPVRPREHTAPAGGRHAPGGRRRPFPGRGLHPPRGHHDPAGHHRHDALAASRCRRPSSGCPGRRARAVPAASRRRGSS